MMFGRQTYEKFIPRNEREALEEALGMESGYVLDFSDRTFNEFFFETVGLDSEGNPHLFNGRGTSKAKRLRSFIERGKPSIVAKVLRELWEYRDANSYRDNKRDDRLRSAFFSIVARFEGREDAIDASAIEAFEPNETLEELVASIRRDLDAKKPHVALDRLHTYCMKRFASLIQRHGGAACGKEEPLHSRVGKYVKILREQRNLTPLSERIIKSAISNFEAMNPIRNDQSFAHDNPDLLEMEEARFIFDSVTAFLRYTKAIDSRLFED